MNRTTRILAAGLMAMLTGEAQGQNGASLSITANSSSPSSPDGVAVTSARVGLAVRGSNTGVMVSAPAADGMYVQSPSRAGVLVDRSANDGVFVCGSGLGLCSPDSGFHNGVEILLTEHHGLYVDGAGVDGVSVNVAIRNGFRVAAAGDDGVFICKAGVGGACVPRDDLHNGVEIGGTEDHGVRIDDAGLDGVAVIAAGRDGLHVEAAGGDGLFVCSAGGVTGCSAQSALHNGIEVGHAEHDGLHVNGADRDGVRVTDTGGDGLHVAFASGVGLRVDAAGGYGLDVDGTGAAARFRKHIIIDGSCVGCSQAVFAVNASDAELVPGDVVELAGLATSTFVGVPVLPEVVAASGEGPILGVVQGVAEVAADPGRNHGASDRRLVPRDGEAAPGEPLVVVVSGLARARVSAYHEPVVAGAKLAAGTAGRAVVRRTIEVEGIRLAESVATLGTALESRARGEGDIWVLVAPQ